MRKRVFVHGQGIRARAQLQKCDDSIHRGSVLCLPSVSVVCPRSSCITHFLRDAQNHFIERFWEMYLDSSIGDSCCRSKEAMAWSSRTRTQGKELGSKGGGVTMTPLPITWTT